MATKKRISKFSLMTLLLAVALCAGVFAVVRLVLNPSVPTTVVQGQVVYGRSGTPAALAVVHAQMVALPDGQKPTTESRMPRYGKVMADMNGHYTLPKMEAGIYNIWTEQAGYTAEALDSLLCDGATAASDLSLVRGGVIAGRVIAAETGEPPKLDGPFGPTVGLCGPSRPKSGSAIEAAPLQDDGTFFIRAAPGENFVYLPWATVDEQSSASVEVVEGQTVEVELKATKRGRPEVGP